MPKEDNKRLQAEADMIAEFYTGLNKKGREFVMLAMIQANAPEYKRPPRQVRQEVEAVFVGKGEAQTAPERLIGANEDLQIFRNTTWEVKRNYLVNRMNFDHLLPKYLRDAPKFSA